MCFRACVCACACLGEPHEAHARRAGPVREDHVSAGTYRYDLFNFWFKFLDENKCRDLCRACAYNINICSLSCLQRPRSRVCRGLFEYTCFQCYEYVYKLNRKIIIIVPRPVLLIVRTRRLF
jgi:hypothetical protein